MQQPDSFCNSVVRGKLLGKLLGCVIICELLLRHSDASAATRYVSPGSPSPTLPYSSWETAARSIQPAIDVSSPGDTVIVGDGVYATGGKVVWGTLSNRIAIQKPITVRSANGPGVTFLVGAGPGGPARCAYLTNGAVLSGFTLTNGATVPMAADLRDQDGAGVWCESIQSVVTNCTLIKGTGQRFAGGAYRGSLYDCLVVSNSAALYGGGTYGSDAYRSVLRGNYAEHGGGAYTGTLRDCTLATNGIAGPNSLGGGAAYCTLKNCVVNGNIASTLAGGGGVAHCTVENSQLNYNSAGTGGGGGAYLSVLKWCRLTGNFASGGGAAASSDLFDCVATTNSAALGGGVYGGMLMNCTLVGNSATSQGGGTHGTVVTNSIVVFNASANGANHYLSAFAYSCTSPLVAGPGNIEANPLFVNAAGGDLRLVAGSPAIDAGLNAVVVSTFDLAGLPRFAGTQVDLGAHEFQAAFRQWLVSYGLSGNGSADFTDVDEDGSNQWQEWVCGTNPINPTSVLRLAVGFSGAPRVTWEALPGRVYVVQRAASLDGTPVYVTVQDNISVTSPGNHTYVDSTPLPPGGGFYRLQVRLP